VGVQRLNVIECIYETYLLLVTVKNLLLVTMRPNSRKEDYVVLSGPKDWRCTLLGIASQLKNPCSGSRRQHPISTRM
jgi:hypothetical protein